MGSERDVRRGDPGRGASTHDHDSTVGKRTLVEGLEAAPAHPAVQRRGADGQTDASGVHAAAARGVATAAGPLPFVDRIQRLFGRHDLSAVQAHTGAEATASARAMGADAYATGNQVVLGDRADLHTVAHEAAHVIQQRGGVQLHGGVGAVGDPYERHADQVADAVVQGRSAEALLDRYAGAGSSGAEITQRATSQSVQRMKVGGNAVAATLSSETRKKHVVAVSDQAAKAQAEYLSTTFVASEADITQVVDADTHDFASSSERSDQVTINGNVKVYLWKKQVPGKGNAATLEVNGVDTQCEIGVVKTGDNKVQVVHFKATLI